MPIIYGFQAMYIKNAKLFYLLLIGLFFSTLQITRADDVYTVIIKKQEAKSQSRWSLGEYLLLKQRISLMDQWLSLNTEENIFELKLGASKVNHEQKLKLQNSTQNKTYSENSYDLGIYLFFMGIELTSQNFSSQIKDLKKSLSLRLLGSSLQSTNLFLKFGQSDIEDNQNKYSVNFFEVSTNIYLLSFLGVSYSYLKSDKDSVTSSNSNYIKMQNSSYGGFIDLLFLRLSYEKFSSKFWQNNNRELKGEKIGINLIF